MAANGVSTKVGDKGKEISVPVTPAPKKKDNKDKVNTPDLSVLQGWYQMAEATARPKHWDFFVIDQFLKGNHDIKGSPDDNSINITQNSDSINFPINKLWANFRAVRAFVTRNKPVVKIEMDDFSEESKTYARRANKILERDNKLNNFRKLNKEWAYYGVKYGIGYRQVGYDKEKHVAIRWTVDPFDLLPVSRTGKFEDSPAIIKTVVRTIAYWRNKYPDANIQPDNFVAADEYKQLSMQIEQLDTSGTPQRVEEQTAIGKEVWYKLFTPNSMGGLINKCLYFDSGFIDAEETPFKEYPFVAYEADIQPNEMYPEGHVKHTIAPQRMINLLNTQMLEYNHVVNRGRYQVPKGSGFQVIQAKEGQIIQYNQGKRIEALPPAPINPMLRDQLAWADEALQIIGSQNDASRGRTPFSGASGALVDSLQNADSNNISDLRDNFEDALAKEAQLILSMYSLFENDGFMMEDKQKDGTVDQFAVVGQGYDGVTKADNPNQKYYLDDNGSYLDYISVASEHQVKASVTSELGETTGARQELLFKLVEAGMPLKFLFKYLELPDGDDIMERIAEENVAEIAQQQMMAEQQAQMQAQGQASPPPGVNGNPVPMPDQETSLIAQLQGQ